MTGIFGGYVTKYLEEYTKNPTDNWKLKDTALFLVISLSARGVLPQAGAVALNEFVPLLPIFQANIVPELQSSPDSGHPIIKLDCIKFLLMFRSHMPDIASMLPLLIDHLSSSSPVVYTFASVCIEKILAMKDDKGSFRYIFVEFTMYRFSQSQTAAFAKRILETHFKIIQKAGGVAHKIAENEYLFKSISTISDV